MTKRFMILCSSPAICAILCASLFAIAACGDDDNPYTPPPPDPNAIETNLTDPAQVIEAHGKALAKKNLIAYEALLDADFEFFPLERDAADFPWMTGDSWPREEELNIIGNMFNPNFAGYENAVDLIEASFTILSQQTLPNGATRLTCTQQGRILTAANDGWSFDTRVVFELISRDGYLRIAKITEIDAVLAGSRGSSSVESNSWGTIKALYRS
jgi:hypothetical protein